MVIHKSRIKYFIFLITILIAIPLLHEQLSQAYSSVDGSLSGTNRQIDLQSLFDNAVKTGKQVYLPPGIIRHRGVLYIRGISVIGNPNGTTLEASNPNNAAIIISGDNPKLSNLKISSSSIRRSNKDVSSLILIHGANKFSIHHVLLVGGDSVGIMVNRSKQGVIKSNTIIGTSADGIHITNGSSDILVERNKIADAGDDGIAVVSYKRNKNRVSHINIEGNTVTNDRWGRGIAVVGGKKVNITGNSIRCTDGLAGIYIASESSYHTYGIDGVHVGSNTVQNCGGGMHGHAAIFIFRGNDPNNQITVNGNLLIDSRYAGIGIAGSENKNVKIYNNYLWGGDSDILLKYLDNPIYLKGNIYRNGKIRIRLVNTPNKFIYK